MPYNPAEHHRRSIRLRGYDYRSNGLYFVTLCVQGRAHLFGSIIDSQMILNAYGQVVMDSWLWLAQQYPYVMIDTWVIMPNHFHGILGIGSDDRMGGSDDDNGGRGGSRTAPTNTAPTNTAPTNTAPTNTRKPLGRLIGAFKTVSTKQINHLRDTPGAVVWQRNYHEHIVRNEDSLHRIRQYIETNPARWTDDSLYDGPH